MKAWGVYISGKLDPFFGAWDTRRHASKTLHDHYKSCHKNSRGVDRCRRGGKTGASTRGSVDDRIPLPLGAGVRQKNIVIYNENNEPALVYTQENVKDLIGHHCFEEVCTDGGYSGWADVVRCLRENPNGFSNYKKRDEDLLEEPKEGTDDDQGISTFVKS